MVNEHYIVRFSVNYEVELIGICKTCPIRKLFDFKLLICIKALIVTLYLADTKDKDSPLRILWGLST